MGRVLGVVQHRLEGGLELGLTGDDRAGVGVAVEPGEVAAGDFHPDAVPRLENVAGGPQVNGVAVGLRPGSTSVGETAESRYLARMMPSVRLRAHPSSHTSTSLAVKSVSVAEVAAQRVTVTGPVTSVSRCNGGVE